MKNGKSKKKKLISSSVEHPVSLFPSQDSEKEWQTLVVTWPLSFADLQTRLNLSGSAGKMSQESLVQDKDGILVPLSGRWEKSGMGTLGECSTHNSSEHNSIQGQSLNDEGVSSLSDILETGDLPPQYYLSKAACTGILLRAERRGKLLPPALQEALKQMVVQKINPTT